MNRTFTNVRGEDAVVARVADCWASLFGERVLAYRAAQSVAGEPAIAVVVQQMVDSDRSGVMFSVDPSTGDPTVVVIEAAWGLGEVVVSGAVEPDTYVVAKDGPRLVSVRVGDKRVVIRRGPDGVERRTDTDRTEATSRVLGDDQVLEIARLGMQVEAHYGEPQDMEWAYAGDELFLVQSRPVTTLGAGDGESAVPATAGPAAAAAASAGEPLVRGLGAAPGVVAGPVRVLHTIDEGRDLARGDILVAPMTTPDWVPTMRRAAALVTDGGGVTCHAAIASRELRVPCVVGTRRGDRGPARRRAGHGGRGVGCRVRGGRA